MKLNQLRLLIAVKEAGSIQGAARASNISQPALSKSIRELERELGVPLLVRGSKGVTLTDYGVGVVGRAVLIERSVKHIREEIGWQRDDASGTVSVGLTPTTIGPNLALALSRFAATWPNVRLRVVEQRPAQILEGLRTAKFDLGILHHYDTATDPPCRYVPLTSFETILVAGGRRADPRISLEALSHANWVVGDLEDDTDGFLPMLARQYDFEMPRQVIRCTSIGLYLEFAQRAGVVSHWGAPALTYVDAYFRDGRLTRLDPDKPLPGMSIRLVFLEEALLSPAAALLARALQAANPDPSPI